jgi:hypothetical protein
MTTQDKEFSLELSRRKLLAAAGIGGSMVLAPFVIGARGATAGSETRAPSVVALAPPIAGLAPSLSAHLRPRLFATPKYRPHVAS